MKIFEHLEVGPLSCNCYIVGDESSKEAVVIDPGDEPDEIMAAVSRHGLTVKAIIATHGHFDHVVGAQRLRESTSAPFLLSESDMAILGTMQDSARILLGIDVGPPPEVDSWLSEGDEVTAGTLTLGVLHTPGHTPGSLSLLVEDDALFSGDTLFYDSIGATHFPGGDHEQEIISIKQRLFTLGDLPVYPGHGPSTSIDREKSLNPFVGIRSRLWTP